MSPADASPSPRVAWEPCPVPSRAGAVPRLPVCVPTHHVPPLDDPGRRIFLSVVAVFFLTKSKYFCPHGDGSGSLSMERHTGVPAGEGTPGSVRRLRCWRLHPWRGPQCLYIDMFVRGTGPFLAPKQLEESQKVKKFSIALGREGARSDCARGQAMPTATDPKCGVRPKKPKDLVLIQ